MEVSWSKLVMTTKSLTWHTPDVIPIHRYLTEFRAWGVSNQIQIQIQKIFIVSNQNERTKKIQLSIH